jgi:SOS-response transcriptional repressor LexA
MDIFDDINEEAALESVGVHAGFPNPATDSDRRVGSLSLDQLLIKRPSSTYLFRLRGHNWEEQGISDGDIAVVDRAVGARPSDLVMTWHGQDFVISYRRQLPRQFVPWGTVTAIVHTYREVAP